MTKDALEADLKSALEQHQRMAQDTLRLEGMVILLRQQLERLAKDDTPKDEALKD